MILCSPSSRIWRLKENKTAGSESTWINEEVVMCGIDTCQPALGLTSIYQNNILSFGEDQDGKLMVILLITPVVSNAYIGHTYGHWPENY